MLSWRGDVCLRRNGKKKIRRNKKKKMKKKSEREREELGIFEGFEFMGSVLSDFCFDLKVFPFLGFGFCKALYDAMNSKSFLEIPPLSLLLLLWVPLLNF